MYRLMGVVFALSFLANIILHRMISRGSSSLKEIQIEYFFFLPLALVIFLSAIIIVFMILWPKEKPSENLNNEGEKNLANKKNLITRLGTLVIPVILQLIVSLFAWYAGYVISLQIS